MNVTIEARDGPRAFYRYLCGAVTCDSADPLFMGADSATSITAEVSGHVFAAAWLLGNESGYAADIPVEVVYDNSKASEFARSVSVCGQLTRLCACLASLWQIVSQRRLVSWRHAFSQCGHPLNEPADSLVEHAAKNPGDRCDTVCIANVWSKHYSAEQIKLMYLLHLPRGLESRTAIRAEAPSTVKWGLPASVLASDIDVLPVA